MKFHSTDLVKKKKKIYWSWTYFIQCKMASMLQPYMFGHYYLVLVPGKKNPSRFLQTNPYIWDVVKSMHSSFEKRTRRRSQYCSGQTRKYTEPASTTLRGACNNTKLNQNIAELFKSNNKKTKFSKLSVVPSSRFAREISLAKKGRQVHYANQARFVSA